MRYTYGKSPVTWDIPVEHMSVTWENNREVICITVKDKDDAMFGMEENDGKFSFWIPSEHEQCQQIETLLRCIEEAQKLAEGYNDAVAVEYDEEESYIEKIFLHLVWLVVFGAIGGFVTRLFTERFFFIGALLGCFAWVCLSLWVHFDQRGRNGDRLESKIKTLWQARQFGEAFAMLEANRDEKEIRRNMWQYLWHQTHARQRIYERKSGTSQP